MNRRNFIATLFVGGIGSALPADVLSLGEPDIDVYELAYELALEDFRDSLARGVDELHTMKRE